MAALPPPILTSLQNVVYAPKFEHAAVRAVAVIEDTFYQVVHAEIEHNAHGATDSAQVVLPISSNPDFSVMFQRSDGTNGTPNNADVPVRISIYAGYPTSPAPQSLDVSQLSLRFSGIVDIYSAHFSSDEVTFKCRNLAAPLVDFPATYLAMNQTSAQLVTELATSVGLTPNILLVNPPVTVQQVFASEFVGGANFASTVANVKAWDLLLKCALFDDVDVWVSLKDGVPYLNYAAPSLIPRTTVNLVYGRDLIDLTVEHSIQYAKNIRVEVHTYQHRIKQATTHHVATALGGGIDETPSSKTIVSSPVFGTAEQTSTTTTGEGNVSTTLTNVSGGASNAITGPGKESAQERYVRYIPNLSPAMCQQVARAIWRQISMHEYRQNITFPMTPGLLKVFDISMLLNVTGSPYSNANSVFTGTEPITNTATVSSSNAATVSSNSTSVNVARPDTRTDTRYWPRRITETIDPNSSGWTLAAETVSHALPGGAV